MDSNLGTVTSDKYADGDSGARMLDEYIEEDPGTRTLDEYGAEDSRIETSDEFAEGAYLLHKSGLRFSHGMRFVSVLADMMEERFKIEEKTAYILQNYSCDWTKTLTEVSSSGNGDFDHGSIHAAIIKFLMEPMEDAKIYNLVKNEGLGEDGPVTFLRSWLEKMEKSHIQQDTLKLYSTAWEKQRSAEEEIEKAMEYYHLRKYKLEYGLRQLKADPPVLSSHEETSLRNSVFRYHFKCKNAREEYRNLLKMEKAERGQALANIKTAQRKFEWFEKNRMMHIAVGTHRFIDIMKKLDTERANHERVFEDIIGVLDKMIAEIDARNLEPQNIHRCQFPVFEEFVEENANQKDEKTTLDKMLNLRIREGQQIGASPEVIRNRKRNKQFKGSEVIIADDSEPNLVKELIISDDDSDISEETTMNDGIVVDNDDNESDTDIFEIDEKGREIKMKPKPHPKSSDARAHDKTKTEHFGLPNAIESDSETEMRVIPDRKREIDLDISQNTSTVPLKLTRKAKKLVYKKLEESAESMKLIKESIKLKDKKQTKVDAEKRKVKEKVHEQITIESSHSDNKHEVRDVAEVRTLGNVKVIAIEDYIAQNRDELTLKAGQKIKQKIPANSDGMAYGWLWKGKLGRKVYGYYPANLVELRPKKEKPGIRGLMSKKSGSLKFAS